MMSHKFRLTRVKFLILAFLFVIYPQNTKAIVNPTNNFYVNDYANLLASETKEYIMRQSVVLNNVDGTQIVVVTVNDLEGYSIEDYANRLFRNFGIGDRNKNNGILILISKEERQLRIEVGYGLEGIINDGKAGRIRDEYMTPYLKEDDFDNGIKNGYNAIYEEIVKGNNLDLDYIEPIQEKEYTYDSSYFFLSFVLGMVLGYMVRPLSIGKKNIFTFIYIFICGVICYTMLHLIVFLIINMIMYVYFAYTKRNPIHFYFTHGGFGGGSSRSSGGFRGGGGSSGGGGASGRF